MVNQGSRLSAELSERRTEENGDQNDLEHVAGDKRLRCTGGNDVEEKGHDAQVLRGRGIACDGRGIERRRINVHSTAGLDEVSGNETQSNARVETISK